MIYQLLSFQRPVHAFASDTVSDSPSALFLDFMNCLKAGQTLDQTPHALLTDAIDDIIKGLEAIKVDIAGKFVLSLFVMLIIFYVCFVFI